MKYVGPKGHNVKSFKKEHNCLERDLDTGEVSKYSTNTKDEDSESQSDKMGENVLIIRDKNNMARAMLKRYDSSCDGLYKNCFILSLKEQLVYKLCQQYKLLRNVVPDYYIMGRTYILGREWSTCGIEKYVPFYDSKELLNQDPIGIPKFSELLKASANSFSMSKLALLNKDEQRKFFSLIDETSYFSALFTSILFNFQDAAARNILCHYDNGKITLHFTDTCDSFDAPASHKSHMMKPFLLAVHFAQKPFPQQFVELVKSLDFDAIQKVIFDQIGPSDMSFHRRAKDIYMGKKHRYIESFKRKFLDFQNKKSDIAPPYSAEEINRKIKKFKLHEKYEYGDPFDNLEDRINMFKDNIDAMTKLSVVEFLFEYSPKRYKISLIKCFEDGYANVKDSGRGFDILNVIKCPELNCNDLWEEMYAKYTDGRTYTEKWTEEIENNWEKWEEETKDHRVKQGSGQQ